MRKKGSKAFLDLFQEEQIGKDGNKIKLALQGRFKLEEMWCDGQA